MIHLIIKYTISFSIGFRGSPSNGNCSGLSIQTHIRARRWHKHKRLNSEKLHKHFFSFLLPTFIKHLNKINYSTFTATRFPYHANWVNITINLVFKWHFLYRKKTHKCYLYEALSVSDLSLSKESKQVLVWEKMRKHISGADYYSTDTNAKKWDSHKREIRSIVSQTNK